MLESELAFNQGKVVMSENKLNKTQFKKKRSQALRAWSKAQNSLLIFNLVSCLGPILFFVGLGFLLDKIFQTKPIFIVVGLFLALATTVFLLTSIVKNITHKTMASLCDDNDLEQKLSDKNN